MTLLQIGQYLQVLITQIAVLINPIAAIQKLVAITAKEHTPYLIEGKVNTIADDVNNSSYGLSALHDQVGTILVAVAALGAPQQAFSPVTLPPTTPSGGAWIDTSNAGEIVWAYIISPSGYGAAALLNFAGMVAYTNGLTQPVQILGAPFFAALANIDYAQPANTLVLPVLDPTAVPYPQSLLDAVNAQNPLWTFDWYLNQGERVVATHGPGGSASVISTLTDDQFQDLVRNAQGITASKVAPVWPGLAGVTLGSAVALVDGIVVAGPMAGVILAITSVPNPISFYPFGSIRSFVRAGALVFTDDNGDSEFPQPFGPENQLILPVMMSSAASCTVRLPSGVVGTIQPFTIP